MENNRCHGLQKPISLTLRDILPFHFRNDLYGVVCVEGGDVTNNLTSVPNGEPRSKRQKGPQGGWNRGQFEAHCNSAQPDTVSRWGVIYPAVLSSPRCEPVPPTNAVRMTLVRKPDCAVRRLIMLPRIQCSPIGPRVASPLSRRQGDWLPAPSLHVDEQAWTALRISGSRWRAHRSVDESMVAN